MREAFAYDVSFKYMKNNIYLHIFEEICLSFLFFYCGELYFKGSKYHFDLNGTGEDVNSAIVHRQAAHSNSLHEMLFRDISLTNCQWLTLNVVSCNSHDWIVAISGTGRNHLRLFYALHDPMHPKNRVRERRRK